MKNQNDQLQNLALNSIKNKIVTQKTKQNFEPNTNKQNLMFFSGISFSILAENAILQRTDDCMPLEILSISACTNFHISCDKLLKYVLSKFNINYENDKPLLNLFLQLPQNLQNEILPNFSFDSKILSTLPSVENLTYYDNATNILQIFHFFNTFQKRIEAIAMDIEQNNFYI